jgi:3-oxoacyl-[acyl-carrier protein] reductase
MDLGLAERACIVTGASRGIGHATALGLAREGAAVLLVGRRHALLERAAEECRGAGGTAATLALDVLDADAARRALAACLEAFGGVEVLVNNAGTSSLRGTDQLTDEDWQEQWELNVMAPMRFMRAIAPAMVERGWGRIVNVASSSGKRPSQTNISYSVTKAAELSLSRAFADQYAARGVLINAVAPGPVATELWTGEGGLADQVSGARGGTREEALHAAAQRIPRGRLATEDEIAAVIVFLCSEAAANVAGAAWSVDGGSVPGIL